MDGLCIPVIGGWFIPDTGGLFIPDTGGLFIPDTGRLLVIWTRGFVPGPTRLLGIDI
jgi:hypothetical protein